MKIINHLLNKYKFIDQYCKMEKKKDETKIYLMERNRLKT